MSAGETTVCGRSFNLGLRAHGKLWTYTELGTFATLELALDAQRKRLGQHCADVIVETEQLARYGVNYGCRTVVRSARTGEILP